MYQWSQGPIGVQGNGSIVLGSQRVVRMRVEAAVGDQSGIRWDQMGILAT